MFFSYDIKCLVNLFSEDPHMNIYLGISKSKWERLSPVSEQWYWNFMYFTVENMLSHQTALPNMEHDFRLKPNKLNNTLLDKFWTMPYLGKFCIRCFMKGTIEFCEHLAFIFCKVSVMKSAAFIKEEEHADKWFETHEPNKQAPRYYFASHNINILQGITVAWCFNSLTYSNILYLIIPPKDWETITVD
jgi:hypothetical protein